MHALLTDQLCTALFCKFTLVHIYIALLLILSVKGHKITRKMKIEELVHKHTYLIEWPHGKTELFHHGEIEYKSCHAPNIKI